MHIRKDNFYVGKKHIKPGSFESSTFVYVLVCFVLCVCVMQCIYLLEVGLYSLFSEFFQKLIKIKIKLYLHTSQIICTFIGRPLANSECMSGLTLLQDVLLKIRFLYPSESLNMSLGQGIWALTTCCHLTGHNIVLEQNNHSVTCAN